MKLTESRTRLILFTGNGRAGNTAVASAVARALAARRHELLLTTTAPAAQPSADRPATRGDGAVRLGGKSNVQWPEDCGNGAADASGRRAAMAAGNSSTGGGSCQHSVDFSGV